MYKNKYYNHFDKSKINIPHILNNSNDFLIRFNTSLKYYKYDNNSLTIFYINEGEGNVVSDKSDLKFKQNHFLITNPGNSWEYINEKGNDINILSFIISDSTKNKFNHYNSLSAIDLLDNPTPEKKYNDSFFIENAFNANMCNSGKFLKSTFEISNSEDYQFVDAQEITFELLNNIYNDQYQLNKKMDRLEAKNKSTKVEILRRLLVANEYINDNIGLEKLSIKEIAINSGMSEFHLFSSFKKIFRRTPKQHINFLKMLKARQLLREQKLSVSEIAVDLGFADLPTFSKLFKKTYGLTPSLYLQR